MPRITVVGSLMMDLVVRVPRLPRPGESLFGRSFNTLVGGKGGNQALASARLGAHATMIGRVGADLFGDRILETLRQSRIDCTHIGRDTGVGTGVAVPLVFDDGGNSIVSLPQANLALTPADIESAADAITKADMLLVQFEVAPAATEEAIRIARAAGVPILLNPAPVSPEQFHLAPFADYLVLNEVEADALAPSRLPDRLAQAQELRSLGPRVVIITLGEAGCVVATKTESWAMPAFAVSAVDSVGAGDAFCGALAVAVADGADLTTAVRTATAAGAISVTRRGAADSLPGRTELDSFLAQH